ncbi:MAG: transcription termination factor NusA [Chlamydiia bacterium]
MNKDLVAIFEYLEREKGIKRELVVSALEEALHAAARKSVTGIADVTVSIHPRTGVIDVLTEKTVVEKVRRPALEIALKDAIELNPEAQLGHRMLVSVMPENFGRIAAQTARQVMAQKLRELERDVIRAEYRHRMGELISGTVKRLVRGQNVMVDLGKVEAILPMREYPKTESYNIGDKVVALLYEVRDTELGGAEVVLSRSTPDFVRALFHQEVPEVADGTIVIEKIAREAGLRSKVVVRSTDMKVDPVGACVGLRGGRIKNILRELGLEKVDIVPHSEDVLELVQNALAPVQLQRIAMSEEEPAMLVIVSDADYPVAIGKRGVNARLTGELAGLHLVIERMSDYEKDQAEVRASEAGMDDPTLDEEVVIPGVNSLLIESLKGAGYDTFRKVLQASPGQLAHVPGISSETADRILEAIRKMRVEKVGQEPQG